MKDMLSEEEIQNLLHALQTGDLDIPEKQFDDVSSPQHYAEGNYECIDVMVDQFGLETVLDFCLLNAFKYIYRCRKKGKFKQDLEKAEWYINYIVANVDEKKEVMDNGTEDVWDGGSVEDPRGVSSPRE